ncbi:mismatch repair endonuclease PMS2-like protein [Leptotrombidium deliense]|uniref:Mismatch repair endonuclease PMS2-like protein n=1 Tax=Leptotrombidium deliense TaxID=299467 RepID=A0A443RZ22_9ACAR|nr:mismatch repair endonuclease PMS2-like protein [Leptotrombidium deliense]
MEIIGQFNKGFVVTKYKSDLFIIDQHASDEKYNFEDLCATTVLKTQPLIHPLDLELGAFQESVLYNNITCFSKSGFQFQFDEKLAPGKRAKLISVPMSKDWVFGKEDIEEMLHEIIESGTIPSNYRPSRVKQMLASRACRKSIMIGDVLTTRQMKKLVENMSTLCNPWTCAHGRPSIRHLFNENHIAFDSLL